jgi:hypothetical protein
VERAVVGGDAAQGLLETLGGGTEVAHRPGPFSVHPRGEMGEVHRGVRGPSVQPLPAGVQLGQRLVAGRIRRGPHLLGQGQPAKEVNEHRDPRGGDVGQQLGCGLRRPGQSLLLPDHRRSESRGDMVGAGSEEVVGQFLQKGILVEALVASSSGRIRPAEHRQPEATEPEQEQLRRAVPRPGREARSGCDVLQQSLHGQRPVQRDLGHRQEGQPGVLDVTPLDTPSARPDCVGPHVLERLEPSRRSRGEEVPDL